jgi:CubicO group peptidase (beta-lactamase class C family)
MTRKKIYYGMLSFLGAAIIGAALYLNSMLPIITGYAAKYMCSAIFISGRIQKDVENIDFNFTWIKNASNNIDFDNKSVTSRYMWRKSKAIYREGFGSTLLRDISEEALRKIKYPAGTEPAYSQDTIIWPLGDIIPEKVTGIDRKALQDITRRLISENSYSGNAFAFMVLHKGIPVTEAYKPQFNHNTRFPGWSIAKSFTGALVGILVRQGRVDINQPVGLEEWKNDKRSKITLNDLMQMQSGLKWNEDYGAKSDVTLMLYRESDMGRYALDKPAGQPAGSFWNYSSGSSNIVSYLIRRQFSNDFAYYTFPYVELFNKIGIPDVIFEVDPSGTRVGSSYIYATARDYARFALLYQNDGVFNGERILPAGWVKYCTSASSSSKGAFGAFFYLNRGKKLPSAPEDMYSCEGHDGQRIFILPEQDLIVVVLGFSHKPEGEMDFDSLLKDILNTLPRSN